MQSSRQRAAALRLLCLLLAAGTCRAVTVTVTDPPATTTSSTSTTASTSTSTTTTSTTTPLPPPAAPPKRAVGADATGDEVSSEGAASGSDEQDALSQERVAILKQINRHNDDGSYTFGYEAADGSFKIETRDVLGNVKGMFGFVDEAGQLKRVAYSASNGTGFRSTDGVSDRPDAGGDGGLAVTTQAPQPTLYHQIIRPGGAPTTRRPSLRYYGLRTHPTTPFVPATTVAPTTVALDEEAVEEPTQRPSVIQRIRRPHIVPVRTERPEVGSTTRRPHLFLPAYLRPLGQPVRIVQPNGQEGTLPVTVPRLASATFGHYPLPPGAPPVATTARPDPRRVVLVTRKPVPVAEEPEESAEEDEEDGEGPTAPERIPPHAKALEDAQRKGEGRRAPKGNALRRQLGDDRLLGPLPRPAVVRVRQPESDDHADVYGGGAAAGNVRPVPDTPFRGYFTAQPRIVQNALLQGFGAARHRAGAPPPPPGAPLSPADLIDTRNAAGARVPVAVPRAVGADPASAPQYVLAGQDVQQQVHQLLLAQQQRYRAPPPPPPPPPPQQGLTPFQQAIMQTLLGGELPPEILRELLQPYGQSGYGQHGYDHHHHHQHHHQPHYQPQSPYPPQQPYPAQQPYSPYPPQSAYPPQQAYHPQAGYPTSQPGYPSHAQSPIPYPPHHMMSPQHHYAQPTAPHQAMVPYAPPQAPAPTPPPPHAAPVPYQPQYPPPMPYSHPLPYEPQQYQPAQFPSAPGAAPPSPPSGQLPYHLQRRLRYRPRPGYITPPPGYYPPQAPFSLRLPIPVYPQPLPFDSPQVQYSGAGGARVGTPAQLMPAEYRDALLLRMLLAIRADQEQRAAQQAQAAAAQHGAQPVATLRAAAAAAEAEAASQGPAPRALQYHVATTARPRPPMRSVQILDPVTEPPAKRSPDNSTATPH